MDGDTVAIELLPENQWSTLSEMVLEEKEIDDQTNKIFDELIAAKTFEKVDNDNHEKARPTGKVVGIICRKRRQYCGILKAHELDDMIHHIFIPADRKIPRVKIQTRQADKLKNQRIVVVIDCWPRNSRYPHGHFVRSLGLLGDVNTENEVILLEHDVPHSKFSQDVLDCLPSLPWSISEEVSCIKFN